MRVTRNWRLTTKNNDQKLYVGTYYLRPPPPTGTILLLR